VPNAVFGNWATMRSPPKVSTVDCTLSTFPVVEPEVCATASVSHPKLSPPSSTENPFTTLSPAPFTVTPAAAYVEPVAFTWQTTRVDA
jgi:hypothetical protein